MSPQFAIRSFLVRPGWQIWPNLKAPATTWWHHASTESSLPTSLKHFAKSPPISRVAPYGWCHMSHVVDPNKRWGPSWLCLKLQLTSYHFWNILSTCPITWNLMSNILILYFVLLFKSCHFSESSSPIYCWLHQSSCPKPPGVPFACCWRFSPNLTLRRISKNPWSNRNIKKTKQAVKPWNLCYMFGLSFALITFINPESCLFVITNFWGYISNLTSQIIIFHQAFLYSDPFEMCVFYSKARKTLNSRSGKDLQRNK